MNPENNLMPQIKIEIPGLTVETNSKSFVPEWFQFQFGNLINEIVKMHFAEISETASADENPASDENPDDRGEYIRWNDKADFQSFKITGFIKYEEKTGVTVQILISKGDSIKSSKNYSGEVDDIINSLPQIIDNIQDFIKKSTPSDFSVSTEVDYNQCVREIIELLQENTDDNSIEKHFLMGMFLAKAGEEEEALKNLDYVINNGSSTEMVQDCYKLVLSVKAKKSMKDLDSAQNEVYNGDPTKAVSLIESLIHITPKYTHLHYLLGTAFKKSGQLEKSIQSFKEALKIDPDNVPAYRELAEELVSVGDLAEAEKMYRKIIELGKANATDYYNLGMCLKRLGRLKEIDEAIEKIKELDVEGKLDSYIFNLFDMQSNLLKEDVQEEKKQSFWGKLFGKK